MTTNYFRKEYCKHQYSIKQDERKSEFYLQVYKLKKEIRSFKTFIQRADLPVVLLGDCLYKLSVYEIDNAIFVLRKALLYYADVFSEVKNVPNYPINRLVQYIEEIYLLHFYENEASN